VTKTGGRFCAVAREFCVFRRFGGTSFCPKASSDACACVCADNRGDVRAPWCVRVGDRARFRVTLDGAPGTWGSPLAVAAMLGELGRANRAFPVRNAASASRLVLNVPKVLHLRSFGSYARTLYVVLPSGPSLGRMYDAGMALVSSRRGLPGGIARRGVTPRERLASLFVTPLPNFCNILFARAKYRKKISKS
jgi:hypothetical protein